MKSCCHRDPDLLSESLSLIKLICYPDSLRFSSRAIQWGCDHEKHALKFYEDIRSEKHTNMISKESGFVISTDHPFIGGSPDGTAKCDCCGEGCVEVKRRFCIKDPVIEEGSNKQGFCLTKNDLGQTQLSRVHAYYYQMQSQINICQQASYGDFIVWSKFDIYIKRILPDKVFWKGLVEKLTFSKHVCYLNWLENLTADLLALFRIILSIIFATE